MIPGFPGLEATKCPGKRHNPRTFRAARQGVAPPLMPPLQASSSSEYSRNLPRLQ